MQTYIYYPSLYTIRRKAEEKTRMAYTAADWKIVYESDSLFMKMYPAFEDFLKAMLARRIAQAKECGAWDKATPEMKKKAARMGVF